MITLNLSTVRQDSLAAPILAQVATFAGLLATRFRRSLDIRVHEQCTRIQRTGLAGML